MHSDLNQTPSKFCLQSACASSSIFDFSKYFVVVWLWKLTLIRDHPIGKLEKHFFHIKKNKTDRLENMQSSIFAHYPFQKSEQLAGSIYIWLPLRMQIERVTSDEWGWRAESDLVSSKRKWNVGNILGWYLKYIGLILGIYWVDTWVASRRVRFWYIAAIVWK